MSNIFEEVKERVRMQGAISFLGLTMKQESPGQWRSACPACKGSQKRDLSINTDKDAFTCFKGNKRGTDATALVAHVKGVSQREAAEMLLEHFGQPVSAPQPSKEAPASTTGALEPLSYLTTDHPAIELLGLTAGAMEALGGGFAARGTMAGRVLIPLRTSDGTLVGYFGIATKEDQVPLLLFPKNLEERCRAEPVQEAKPPADELRKLFRVVS